MNIRYIIGSNRIYKKCQCKKKIELYQTESSHAAYAYLNILKELFGLTLLIKKMVMWVYVRIY